MIDPKRVLSDPENAAVQWNRRGLDGSHLVRDLATLDRRRKEAIIAHDAAKGRQSALSQVFRSKTATGEEKAAAREQLRPLSDEIKAHADVMKEAQEAIRQQLLGLENWAHASVPAGQGDADNVTVREWGERPTFDFEPREHAKLGADLGILDMERAARISGSRFAVYRGAGARLERALMGFMLDMHTTEHGYTELLTPYLVTRETMTATGQLPKFEDDAFKTAGDDLFLIPTSEVSVTNLHRGETLASEELPLRYTAYSSCFRREAGSYGKDTKGIARLHQFQKVEMVKLCRPEESYEELEGMTRNAEAVLQRLGLPYRVMALCSRDLGFASAKTYDLEVWLPGANTYREISSCSNCEDFQARRAKIRYRPARGEKPRFVHTLNGSGLAIGRTIIALLENHQRADGSVAVPAALVPYMGGLEVIHA